jgi:pimeloyl-ACP methyl ester carboxylesterase
MERNTAMDSQKKSKKIFLILGIARESDNWRHPVQQLQATLPDYEIIALDNAGMGVYHKMKTPFFINSNLDFLKKQFDLLKGEENYLLGWSMGGMIVAAWNKRYPNDMKGILLMTTSFGAFQMPWYRLRIEILLPITIAIFSQGAKREQRLFNGICRNETNREMLTAEWLKAQQERPVSPLNILRQLHACIYFLGYKFKQTHPTLIIGAPQDQLVNNKCSTAIAKRWKSAKYVEHPTVGHDVFNDAPEWVSNEIKIWLKEI